ncbi:MAG: hypothetical protein NC429_12835 [Lachnospiraceae bacterium]|nr:hypothetical protein [Lachnospiraceae bacterium]
MERDVISNAFFSDNERYADIINGIGCDGFPFVKAEDLQEADTKVVFKRRRRFGRRKKRGTAKYRDLMRKTAFGMNFAMIGIENQEEIDYALALRVMCYDAGEYERQAAEIPKGLKEKVSNYRIHVVEVRKLKDTDIFQTDVKQVFDFIRFSKDKKKLQDLLDGDEAYQLLDEEAYDMVAAYVGEEEAMFKRKEKHKKGGKVNMCQGLREWLADERMEGRTEGRLEGRTAGKAEAILDLLSERGVVNEGLKDIIMREKDAETLRAWLRLAADAESVEEFEGKLKMNMSLTIG